MINEREGSETKQCRSVHNSNKLIGGDYITTEHWFLFRPLDSSNTTWQNERKDSSQKQNTFVYDEVVNRTRVTFIIIHACHSVAPIVPLVACVAFCIWSYWSSKWVTADLLPWQHDQPFSERKVRVREGACVCVCTCVYNLELWRLNTWARQRTENRKENRLGILIPVS